MKVYTKNNILLGFTAIGKFVFKIKTPLRKAGQVCVNGSVEYIRKKNSHWAANGLGKTSLHACSTGSLVLPLVLQVI
jgi:hypothetical protein